MGHQLTLLQRLLRIKGMMEGEVISGVVGLCSMLFYMGQCHLKEGP